MTPPDEYAYKINGPLVIVVSVCYRAGELVDVALSVVQLNSLQCRTTVSVCYGLIELTDDHSFSSLRIS